MEDKIEQDIEAEVQKRVAEQIKELEKISDDKLNKYLSDPRHIIQAYAERVSELEITVMLNKPKVEFAETVLQTDDQMDMDKAAKTLSFKGWGRNNIFKLLRERKYLRFNNDPYQDYVDSGLFALVENTFTNNAGEEMVYRKTVVTQKGLSKIKDIINEFDPSTVISND